jgi:hypothetical protein
MNNISILSPSTVQKLEEMPMSHVVAAREAVDTLMEEIDALPPTQNQSIIIHALLKTRLCIDQVIERRNHNA